MTRLKKICTRCRGNGNIRIHNESVEDPKQIENRQKCVRLFKETFERAKRKIKRERERNGSQIDDKEIAQDAMKIMWDMNVPRDLNKMKKGKIPAYCELDLLPREVDEHGHLIHKDKKKWDEDWGTGSLTQQKLRDDFEFIWSKKELRQNLSNHFKKFTSALVSLLNKLKMSDAAEKVQASFDRTIHLSRRSELARLTKRVYTTALYDPGSQPARENTGRHAFISDFLAIANNPGFEKKTAVEISDTVDNFIQDTLDYLSLLKDEAIGTEKRALSKQSKSWTRYQAQWRGSKGISSKETNFIMIQKIKNGLYRSPEKQEQVKSFLLFHLWNIITAAERLYAEVTPGQHIPPKSEEQMSQVPHENV